MHPCRDAIYRVRTPKNTIFTHTPQKNPGYLKSPIVLKDLKDLTDLNDLNDLTVFTDLTVLKPLSAAPAFALYFFPEANFILVNTFLVSCGKSPCNIQLK